MGKGYGGNLYDCKPSLDDLHPNDRVLVRKLSERRGHGKLWLYWEQDIYRVIQHIDPLSPVYKIQCENRTVPISVLHRNLLFQSNKLRANKNATPQKSILVCHKGKTCHIRSTTQLSNSHATVCLMSDSDSEDKSFITSDIPPEPIVQDTTAIIELPNVDHNEETMSTDESSFRNQSTQQDEMQDNVVSENTIEQVSQEYNHQVHNIMLVYHIMH